MYYYYIQHFVKRIIHKLMCSNALTGAIYLYTVSLNIQLIYSEYNNQRYLTVTLGCDSQTVDRARPIFNNAGIITIGLRSEAEKEQVMRSKHKLRYTDSYYDVYIDDGVEQRIQQKLQVLMNTMKGLQQQVPSSRNVHPQRYVRGQRPQTNRYQHSD